MADKLRPIDPQAVKNRPFTTLAWMHLAGIVLIWASPFLVRWWLILTGICLYFMQIAILGDCFMTRLQFSTKKRSVTFYYYLLVKFGFAPNGYRVRFLADYVMPPIILGFALVWQLALDKSPLLI
ncbi:MAG: hypothetical protein WC544_00710 [Patescibacteria group bacterium]